MEWIKNLLTEHQIWLTGGGVAAAVALVLRLFPKAKLLKWSLPWSGRAGRLFSVFLTNRLGQTPAQRVEEGPIVTVAAVLTENIKYFIDNLLADNRKQ